MKLSNAKPWVFGAIIGIVMTGAVRAATGPRTIQVHDKHDLGGRCLFDMQRSRDMGRIVAIRDGYNREWRLALQREGEMEPRVENVILPSDRYIVRECE
ncbi:hypothetical protein [Thioalkalivibrio sp.]|uniref:hypothetical protein n=1 Tax=Thioalkalivibrio sp. TaxID=2093813 RepID=UPI0035648762